jgi:hypothetical protein
MSYVQLNKLHLLRFSFDLSKGINFAKYDSMQPNMLYLLIFRILKTYYFLMTIPY